MNSDQVRVYNIKECISFKKTNEEFGGLSNMASGFPLKINNIDIKTSEALYQSMRFPDYPDIQKEIIYQKSPMTAKMISKKYRKIYTREDWNKKRISIMRWCLQVKLVQNMDKFGLLLIETKDKNIVEISRKDDFWGTIQKEEFLIGVNALGRLLMELREYHKNNIIEKVEPLNINNFRLFGEKITDVYKNKTDKIKTSLFE